MTGLVIAYGAGIGSTTWSFESREAVAHLTKTEPGDPAPMSPCTAQIVHFAALISGPVHGFEAGIPALLLPASTGIKVMLCLATMVPSGLGNHFSEVKESQAETRTALSLHEGRKPVRTTTCGFLAVADATGTHKTPLIRTPHEGP